MIHILYIVIKSIWFVKAIQEGYSLEIKFVKVYVSVCWRGVLSSLGKEIATYVTAQEIPWDPLKTAGTEI